LLYFSIKKFFNFAKNETSRLFRASFSSSTVDKVDVFHRNKAKKIQFNIGSIKERGN